MREERKGQQRVGRQRRRDGQPGAAGAQRRGLGDALARSERLRPVGVRTLDQGRSGAVKSVKVPQDAARPRRRLQGEERAKSGGQREKAEQIFAGSASRRVVHSKTIGRVRRYSR